VSVPAAIPTPRPLLGRRTVLVTALLVLGTLSGLAVGLRLGDLVPSGRGWELTLDFLAAALRPALDHEAAAVPPGTPPFPLQVGAALLRTVAYALAAMSLAMAAAVPLAFLASSAWWRGRGRFGAAVRWTVRGLVVFLRSVHELLWAILFLAAFGLSPATGLLALALPYTGILAKVWSEILDEADPRPAAALEALGASPATRFLFGLLPVALPDVAAYAFYRLECCVRSAAVLGFFGIPTIGFLVARSFENLHYREVWTQLWALVAVVLVLEGWSARLRRRFVA